MVIDVHNHPFWYGYNTKRFIDDMDKNGIDKTVLLTWVSPVDEYDPKYNPVLPDVGENEGPISFKSVLEMVKQEPDRFIPAYCPDPRKPEAIDKLMYAVDTYGVKICGELKMRMCYDNLDAISMFRACGEKDLPVLVHLDDEWPVYKKYPRPNYWYGGGIDALERVLQKCPDTKIIGHAPGFWSYISGEEDEFIPPYQDGVVKPGGKLVEMLRKYPNLYCDMSAGSGWKALSRDMAFTEDFLTEFQDRVCFGRDCFEVWHLDLMKSLKLDEKIKDKIYYKNASKLLKINIEE